LPLLNPIVVIDCAGNDGLTTTNIVNNYTEVIYFVASGEEYEAHKHTEHRDLGLLGLVRTESGHFLVEPNHRRNSFRDGCC